MSDLPTQSGLKKQSPLLVTGGHRTGTTWVGKMLAASGQVGYISEPLNLLHRPGIFLAQTDYWYTYICKDNESAYKSGFSQTLEYRYHLAAEIKSLRSLHDFSRMGRDLIHSLYYKTRECRPLIKDPFAFFSAPWFADQFGCDVVITIRHPAAFVSSLKRLRWPFDLGDLLHQPLLMRDKLEPFRLEMERLLENPYDEIGHNSFLWKIIYIIAKDFKKDHPQFHIVRQEDLSLQPIQGFRKLYQNLDLKFSARVSEAILASTNSENPKELTSDSAHSINLNSKANLENWKHRLTTAEIKRVRELTEEAAEYFYPDLDWD